jgi:hypothetical protein
MTISNDDARKTFAGNGSTTVFNYTMDVAADADLIVTLVTDATGAEVVKVLTTAYTVAGAGTASGSVTTTSFTPQIGETLVVERAEAYTQAQDINRNRAFPADAAESALDKLTRLVQQLLDKVNRTIKLPITDDPDNPSELTIPSPETGKFVRGNTAADGWENAAITGLGSVGIPVIVSEGGTGATTAPAARTNLGSGATGDALFVAATQAAAKTALGQMDTADIADNAITLAKMAGGTDGQLITYDASGDPVAFGPGTVGQVVTSNGAGAAPSFQTLSDWSAWSSLDLSNGGANDTSQWDFLTGQSGLSEIEFFFEEHSPSSAAILEIVLGDSGGFEVTGYNGGVGSDINGTTSGSTNSTEFSLQAATHAATAVMGGRGRLQHLGSNKWALSFHGHGSGGTNDGVHIASGTKTLSGELTQVRAQLSAGNFTDTGAALLWYRTK